MSGKPKSVVRGVKMARVTATKKSAPAKTARATGAKQVAKAKRYRVPTQVAPGVRTRTSLVGAKIYPASVEPSKRAKKVVAALAGPSFAA